MRRVPCDERLLCGIDVLFVLRGITRTMFELEQRSRYGCAGNVKSDILQMYSAVQLNFKLH